MKPIKPNGTPHLLMVIISDQEDGIPTSKLCQTLNTTYGRSAVWGRSLLPVLQRHGFIDKAGRNQPWFLTPAGELELNRLGR